MKKPFAYVVAASLLAALGVAHAHHSFPAVFDGTKPVAISGKIVRVEWTNPHIWFFVETADADGKPAEWGFSGAPPGVLMRRGINKDVLKIGADVKVEGFRARDGSNHASAGRVTFPDGRNVFTASSEDATPK
jgi:hypothetical protein